MKTYQRILIVAIASSIVGGIVGYVAGTRTASGELAGLVRQLALSHAAGETAVYSQVLKALREGDQVSAIDRLETLLDYSVIHFGEYYAPEYNEQLPWVSHAFHRALDYRTVYPHRPSSDWAAKRYDSALALKIDTESSQ
jgi:hypothetical protein